VTVADALVRRARNGDEQAFRDLYRTVQPGLLRYLRVLVGDQDAPDVASETWLQVIRDLGSFRGDDQDFRAWTATVGRHRALDHLRRSRRRPSVQTPPELLDELPVTSFPGGDPSGGDPADLVAVAMSTDAAIALIARLPPEQAEAVLLRVVMGLDAAAAGRVLGKRPGAVRVAAHRGLRRLAVLLDRAGTAGGEGVTDPAVTALKGMR
jgi:RNA polymerase sigma-70 factor, ECF subfamily